MDEDDDALNAGLRAVADSRLALEREHPSAEELVRHARGELPEADRERVQDHLAICPVCARLRLALPQLRISDGWPATAGRPSPWRRFALAAVLLVAVASGWMLARSRDPRELRPEINLPTALLTLDPARQAADALLVPPDAKFLMVVIPLPDAAGRGLYEVRVAHRGSALTWTSPPVEPRHGEITLTFATSEVRPGVYDLTVDELREADPRRIGETSLQIRRDGRGR